jgi:hypothetical protein
MFRTRKLVVSSGHLCVMEMKSVFEKSLASPAILLRWFSHSISAFSDPDPRWDQTCRKNQMALFRNNWCLSGHLAISV